MQMNDWLALVARYSDAWLMAIAFFFGNKLDHPSRWDAILVLKMQIIVVGQANCQGAREGRCSKIANGLAWKAVD